MVKKDVLKPAVGVAALYEQKLQIVPRIDLTQKILSGDVIHPMHCLRSLKIVAEL